MPRSSGWWRRPTRSCAQEGDLLARQRAWRPRPGDAPASAEGGPERRGAEERRLRRLSEPGSRRIRRAAGLARTDANPRIRGEALFWLAQKAGQKAAAAITERIEQDPDTEVKKRAVFALSQLPKDEGVPLLINVARTHTNPAVRKQAMFWLGQSKDPRAVEFFAEILK